MSENIDLADLRIAVVDDHSLVLEGFRSLLRHNGICNVELFRSAAALVDILKSRPYDIYIIDVEMPDMDGYLLIEAIRNVWHDSRIIVSTIHDELWVLQKLMRYNVNAIVYKSVDMKHVIDAIRSVCNDEYYYCDEVKDILGLAKDEVCIPSSREMDVLQEIAKGHTSKEIATALCISENTVEAHRKSLFQKLKVRNLAHLIIKAVERGYIR